MRSFPILLASLILVACGGDADTSAGDTTEVAAVSAPSIADFAGTWQNSVTLDGVADPVPSTMTGSASGTDWTMSLEGRPPIALQVSMSGDSLVTESAEYESILRPGVMTVVRSAAVMQGNELVGNVVVRYRTATGEEVVNGTIRGTRAP